MTLGLEKHSVLPCFFCYLRGIGTDLKNGFTWYSQKSFLVFWDKNIMAALVQLITGNLFKNNYISYYYYYFQPSIEENWYFSIKVFYKKLHIVWLCQIKAIDLKSIENIENFFSWTCAVWRFQTTTSVHRLFSQGREKFS